ncbi:MAG: hypothetical protein R8M14_02245 [Ghiorsea sp.]
MFSAPVKSPLLSFGAAGFVPGLSADLKVLKVFSIYQTIIKSGRKEFSPFMASYLNRASLLDPEFFDVYRLAGSLLVYDAELPKEGVALLDRGSIILKNSWELPFYGGFIAHQQLKDDEIAFKLMNRVIGRPHTPPLAISLAAKFLSNTNSKEDGILFLQGMLLSMPKGYRAGIEKKIKELRGQMAEQNL